MDNTEATLALFGVLAALCAVAGAIEALGDWWRKRRILARLREDL